jgi:hypothetical protein
MLLTIPRASSGVQCLGVILTRDRYCHIVRQRRALRPSARTNALEIYTEPDTRPRRSEFASASRLREEGMQRVGHP